MRMGVCGKGERTGGRIEKEFGQKEQLRGSHRGRGRVSGPERKSEGYTSLTQKVEQTQKGGKTSG